MFDDVDSPDPLIQEEVESYLNRLGDSPLKHTKLYGLVLLRKVANPRIVSFALSGKAGRKHDYFDRSLRQLSQDYAFIFTNESPLSFREDVRRLLRHWLLKNGKEPVIRRLIQRIRENQQRRLEDLEEQYAYQSLRERLLDDAWVETYLDLVEAQFWINPSEGIRYGITFLLAASLYCTHTIQELGDIGSFFEHHMESPYVDWWHYTLDGLIALDSDKQLHEILAGLEKLEKLITRQKLLIPFPMSTYTDQLIAALWWQQGEWYRTFSLQDALAQYHKALPFLVPERDRPGCIAQLYWLLAAEQQTFAQRIDYLDKAIQLQPDFADAYYNLGNVYFQQKQYRSALTCYHYVIELTPFSIDAWINLGNVYVQLREYQRALDEFTYVLLHLDQKNAHLYYNRANVYRSLRRYSEAIDDFDSAIEIDNTLTWAFLNRGNVYAALKMREKACQDYLRASQLSPRDIHPLWLQEWIQFGKQCVNGETARKLEEIAACDPQNYIATVCRGIARFLKGGDLKMALFELERASKQVPDQYDSYFWQALLAAYGQLDQLAITSLKRAIDLGLPALLMTPLYWLEGDQPEFFQQYLEEILQTAQL